MKLNLNNYSKNWCNNTNNTINSILIHDRQNKSIYNTFDKFNKSNIGWKFSNKNYFRKNNAYCRKQSCI